MIESMHAAGRCSEMQRDSTPIRSELLWVRVEYNDIAVLQHLGLLWLDKRQRFVSD